MLSQNLIQLIKSFQETQIPKIRRWGWKWIAKGYRLRRSHNPQHQYQLAQALLNSGEPEKTIAYCQQLNSQNPQIQSILAEAYQSMGEWAAAIDAEQKAIALDPENAERYHQLGKRYSAQEQYQPAIVAYQQAIQLNPASPWFYYSLGVAQFKLGQWNAAIESLQYAQRSLPREDWINYHLGEALLAVSQTDTAIEQYRQVVKRSPWLLYLGDCLAYAEHILLQDRQIDEFCKTIQVSSKRSSKCSSKCSSKRRMLMITPYPTYPPTTGAIARMFHEMKAMGEVYDLTVVSFVFQKRGFEIERALLDYCEFAVTIVMGDCPEPLENQPNLIHRYRSKRMNQVLKKLSVIPFDFVLTDFIQMAQYRDHFPNAFHILGEHNIESELLRQSAQLQSQKELQQLASQHASFQGFLGGLEEVENLARYECVTWPKFNLRMVVSEPDRNFLVKHCDVGDTIVVSNGIDTQTIQPLPDQSNKILLFIGTLSYYPNIDGVQYFVQEILPLIWERDAAVQFWVAGAEPPQSLLELARDSRIKIIANPPDMTEIARQCCLTVVPLRVGSGTRIKILHAMAMGLPIVTTSLGCEGIDVTDGDDLWIRDRPEDFASATVDLLQNGDWRQQFRLKGRALVEANYNWTAIFKSAIEQIEAAFARR
jgi:glycosyltransferase involved in cell wall biosynthesis/Flp pilus assembly protein TadD